MQQDTPPGVNLATLTPTVAARTGSVVRYYDVARTTLLHP
jgi:hypothetical protein